MQEMWHSSRSGNRSRNEELAVHYVLTLRFSVRTSRSRSHRIPEKESQAALQEEMAAEFKGEHHIILTHNGQLRYLYSHQAGANNHKA